MRSTIVEEKQWLSYIDFPRLLNHLKRTHQVGRSKNGKRKLRLFACACCRVLLWDLPVPKAFHQMVEVAEAFADERKSQSQLLHFWRGRIRIPEPYGSSVSSAAYAMHQTTQTNAANAARWVAHNAVLALKEAGQREVKKRICDLLRDVFGNPFRPLVAEPNWLSWHDGTIPKIAQTIYDERRFEDLPILADALEEAGCTEATILQHCREPGQHVRGCWVVDLLLGKHYIK